MANNSNRRYRLKVNKTTAHIYVSLIDDIENKTLASSSTLSLKHKNLNVKSSYEVGIDIGKKVVDLKLNDGIWFDRNKNRYHGRVKALADGARKSGLEF